MAVHWSSENIVAEHKDVQATAMALDWKGQFVLLACKRSIVVIDLEKPREVTKRMSRMQQKYDVSSAEWNPTSHSGQKFVLAVGEKADIFSWHNGSFTNEKSLKAHTRNITDLNWHKTDPNLLTTCSIDTFIHFWDIRETRKPVNSLSAVAGAAQVKWNKVNPNLLASGHDCDIRIWDKRKTNQPMCYINAHLSKIHCLDWSPNNEGCFASCSNDSTVKLFDINNPRLAETFINTHSPVWRARFTPFGESVVTVVVPPLRRGENSLLLWSVYDRSAPLHTFVGHSDVVLEFEWRNEISSQSEQQLVTWARDHTLRIWHIVPQLLKFSGQNLDGNSTETIEAADANEADTLLNDMKKELQSYISIDENNPDTESKSSSQNLTVNNSLVNVGIPLTSDKPVETFQYLFSLDQEFANLNSVMGNTNLHFVEIITDEQKRLCQVTARQGSYNAVLLILLPGSYPKFSSPTFKFSNGTNIDNSYKGELAKNLRNIAALYLKKKKGCLEACIRVFAAQFKQMNKMDERTFMEAMSCSIPVNQVYGGQQDYNVPFPRTSGARFCGSGQLVCFTRPTLSRQGPSGSETTLPRSLSALGANITTLLPKIATGGHTTPKYTYLYPSFGQNPPTDNISISMYYYQDRKMKSKPGKNDECQDKFQNAGKVLVYDISSLVPTSKELGAAYVLNVDDIVGSCHKNKDVATAFGRKDLAQVWSVAALVATFSLTSEKKEEYPSIHHPFGCRLIMALLDHYLKCHDVQTAAMLSCIFAEKPFSVSPTSYMKKVKPAIQHVGSPYKTIHGMNMESFDFFTRIRHCRSNSEGSLAEAARSSAECSHNSNEKTTPINKTFQSFLDPSKALMYHEIRRAYSNMLYIWEELEQRAMINKYIHLSSVPQKMVEFQLECVNCGQSSHYPHCLYCRKYSFKCSLCHAPVKGSSNFCFICGHGGHALHFQEWFQENTECPTGCGCFCLTEMEELFK